MSEPFTIPAPYSNYMLIFRRHGEEWRHETDHARYTYASNRYWDCLHDDVHYPNCTFSIIGTYRRRRADETIEEFFASEGIDPDGENA
jgi:hypothetical protein